MQNAHPIFQAPQSKGAIQEVQYSCLTNEGATNQHPNDHSRLLQSQLSLPHQYISRNPCLELIHPAKNAVVNLICEQGFLSPEIAKYSHLEKILPTGNICVANAKRPSKDCISFNKIFFLCIHSYIHIYLFGLHGSFYASMPSYEF